MSSESYFGLQDVKYIEKANEETWKNITKDYATALAPGRPHACPPSTYPSHASSAVGSNVLGTSSTLVTGYPLSDTVGEQSDWHQGQPMQFDSKRPHGNHSSKPAEDQSFSAFLEWSTVTSDSVSSFAFGEHDFSQLYADGMDEYIARLSVPCYQAHIPEVDMFGPFNPSLPPAYSETAVVDPYGISCVSNAFGNAQAEDQYLRYVDEARLEQPEPRFDELTRDAQQVSYKHRWSEFCREEEKIDYEMMSKPVVTFVVDAKGKSVPMATCYILVKSINGVPCGRLMKVLLDSGGSATLINRRALPKATTIDTSGSRTMVQTLAGNMAPIGRVRVEGLRLPEFDKSLILNEHTCLTFDRPDCQYDMIVGSDFLAKFGINLNFNSLQVEWFGQTLPMNSTGFTKERQALFLEQYLLEVENEQSWRDCDDGIERFIAAPIMDSKYEKNDIDTVIEENCQHLTLEQQRDLKTLLLSHTKLFDGTLGCYPHDKMTIELEPNAKPVYRRAYPVPHVHKAAFKKELDRLTEIGVLSKVEEPSLWCLPTFIVPKKLLPGESTPRVRWVSDLRELNKVVKPVQYQLPRINDILRKRRGYEFFTKLDVSMQFYTFELDDKSKELCTVATPFGNYRYNRVPMGLKISPAFAQAKMEQCLRDIEEADVYIDDIAIFDDDWKSHMKSLDLVLTRLEENGFTINPLKCQFVCENGESDFLGYWMTPTGVKPWSKKIEAIVNMERPTTATELRTFLGMVTYYREMWPRRAHVLKPLTDLTGLPKKAKLEWTPEMDTAFKQMKAIISEDALLAYPDHNKPFEIYTDASDYQLGACLMQGGRPVAYYSRKLNSAQRNYTTMEKELLAIVETLKEYRSMLLGAEITVFTDHKNLTYENFNTQRVMRWRCFIEEYSPKLVYLEGKLNVLADAYSRLPRFEPIAPQAEDKTKPAVVAHFIANMPRRAPEVATDGLNPKDDVLSMAFSLDPVLVECLRDLPDDIVESHLNLPANGEPSPLRYQWLKSAQDNCHNLQQRLQQSPAYSLRQFGDIDLIVHTDVEGRKNDIAPWKICLTDDTVEDAIVWFNNLLGHPGKERLKYGMRLFYHPNLSSLINRYNSETGQRFKADTRGYGHLPARQVRGRPWEQVDVDLIGPWTVQTRTGKTYEFNALTCIDRFTGLPELIRIENKTAAHVADKFKECWLCRYPRPETCVHDNGKEFLGDFGRLLYSFGISDVSTLPYTPTANSICERMHREVGNLLRSIVHENPPRTLADAKCFVDSALATAMHSLRTNVSAATGNAPGALAFHRDMLIDVPLTADLRAIRARRQLRVDADLRRANARRYDFDYQPGQSVLLKRHDFTKLGERWDGPYTVQRCHVNGTLTLEFRPGLTKRVNIRRLKPFKPEGFQPP